MKISNFLNLKSIIVKLKNIDIAGERNFRRDWRIVATSGLIIILGAISIIPKMHGYNRFPSIFVEFLVFAIFVRIVEVYIKKSLKKKSK